jgi:glutaredoxin
MKQILALAIVLAFPLIVSNSLHAAQKPTTATVKKIEAPKIVMYVMPECGYCAKARAYLNERGLTFTEVDIAASESNKQEWQKNGGQGTPLLLIGDKKVQGFDQAAIDAALTSTQRN